MKKLFMVLAAMLLLGLISCGSGGGGGSSAPTPAAPTYSISGTVSGAVAAGVTITLSGAGSATTTTNASGNYSFSGLANGNYTVTPSLAGYTFSPVNQTVTINGANGTVSNFIASSATSNQLKRILVLSTQYSDTQQQVSIAQIGSHFNAVKSLLKELSFGKADISLTFTDVGVINQKTATIDEWQQTGRILYLAYYSQVPKPTTTCNLSVIAPLAQLYLDGLSDDQKRTNGISISTLNLDYAKQSADPCSNPSAAVIVLAESKTTIPTQYNLDDYDVIVYSIYDDSLNSGGIEGLSLSKSVNFWQNGQVIDRPDKIMILVGATAYNMRTTMPYDTSIEDSNGNDIYQDSYYTQNQQPLSQYARVIAHEIIHAYGVGHDNGITYYTDQQFADQVNSNPRIAYINNSIYSQPPLEYGDWFSIMGATYYAFGLADPTREFLGWLTSDRINIIQSTTKNINIQDINSPTGKLSAKVRVNGGWIYASYHTGTGHEESLKIPQLINNTKGLQLRFTADNVHTSILLDPNGNVKDNDYSLKTGESFDVLGVKFTNVQISTNGLFFDAIYTP